MVCSSFIMMVRSRSGISPVVATVILVAVAIVIAIAVAFWASGLVGIFTRFEKLEIVSAIMTNPNTFQATIRNTGSADTAIDQVILNGQFPSQPLPQPFLIRVGQQLTCTVTVNNPPPPGITVELAFHSTGGKTYPTAVLSTLGTGNAPWNPGQITLNCVGPGGGGGGGGGGG